MCHYGVSISESALVLGAWKFQQGKFCNCDKSLLGFLEFIVFVFVFVLHVMIPVTYEPLEGVLVVAAGPCPVDRYT
jgi:hypothetical protein